MSWLKWAAYGALAVVIALLLWNAYKKYEMNRLHKEAVKGAQVVGILPNDFLYSDDMTQFCYQAALQGYTPDDCLGFYQYAQTYYPEFYSYLGSYWPFYYNNYYYPYYGRYRGYGYNHGKGWHSGHGGHWGGHGGGHWGGHGGGHWGGHGGGGHGGGGGRGGSHGGGRGGGRR